MVSAIKIKGVPLYKLARKGIEVEREPRLIHIYSFRFTRYEAPLGQFRVACTKALMFAVWRMTLAGNSDVARTCRPSGAAFPAGLTRPRR